MRYGRPACDRSWGHREFLIQVLRGKEDFMYLDWCFRGLANVNFTYKTLFFFSVLFFSSNLQGVIQGDFFFTGPP